MKNFLITDHKYINHHHWTLHMFKLCRDFCYRNYASSIWILALKYAYHVNRSWQRFAKCTICINHSCRLFSSIISFFLTNWSKQTNFVSLSENTSTHSTLLPSLPQIFETKRVKRYMTKTSGAWNKKKNGYTLRRQTWDFECTKSGCSFFCHSLYFPSKSIPSTSYFLSLF